MSEIKMEVRAMRELQNSWGRRTIQSEVKIGDKYYRLSLAETPDMGPEFMVFNSSEEGWVSDWQEIFVRYPDRVSKRRFRQCCHLFKCWYERHYY